jgi:general secretion pathway protein N
MVLVIAVALAWWFPAAWAWHLVRGNYPDVRLESVHGTVWHGRARKLIVDGQPLGRLDWRVSRRAVFGHLKADVALNGLGTRVSGHIARAADDAILVRNARFRWPAARLTSGWWPPDAQARGALHGKVSRLRLVDGWPVKLKAQVTWRSAQVIEDGKDVKLGTIQSQWQAQGGTVIHADIADADDGPLHVRGRFVATALGWRLEAHARPRGRAPALRRLLERIGTPAADGSITIGYRGGLAAPAPTRTP